MDLQARIWSMQPEMIVPTHMLHALTYGGGCLIGAAVGGTLVAFVLGFPARPHGRWILWSHMAGVLPEHQGRAIGYAIKMAQRDWALRAGFDTMAWTYDPMQSRNARFNLHKLRAMSDTYHADFYGELPDALNAGLPTDRLEITWALDAPRVNALDDPAAPPPEAIHVSEAHCALRLGEGGELLEQPIDPAARACFVEAPEDIGRLKQQSFALAEAWQLALRRTLTGLFARGYAATDFVVEQGHHYYVLTHDRR